MFVQLFLEKDFQDSFLYYPGKEKNTIFIKLKVML